MRQGRCITHLPVEAGADRSELLVRGHRYIEHRLHRVPDDTFQEDRCACARHGDPESSKNNIAATVAQDDGPQPCPTGAEHGPVTTLSISGTTADAFRVGKHAMKDRYRTVS